MLFENVELKVVKRFLTVSSKGNQVNQVMKRMGVCNSAIREKNMCFVLSSKLKCKKVYYQYRRF